VRAAQFRSANTRICEICNEEDEDIEHFLLGCKILQAILLNNVKHLISICSSMGSIPDIIYKTGSGAFFGKESIPLRRDF
jgi:hypothetical protein